MSYDTEGGSQGRAVAMSKTYIYFSLGRLFAASAFFVSVLSVTACADLGSTKHNGLHYAAFLTTKAQIQGANAEIDVMNAGRLGDFYECFLSATRQLETSEFEDYLIRYEQSSTQATYYFFPLKSDLRNPDWDYGFFRLDIPPFSCDVTTPGQVQGINIHMERIE